MKLTQKTLLRIIKEEVSKLNEATQQDYTYLAQDAGIDPAALKDLVMACVASPQVFMDFKRLVAHETQQQNSDRAALDSLPIGAR